MKLMTVFKQIVLESSGTTSRLKTYDRIEFDKPLIGPTGYKLVAYEWKYKWEDYFSEYKGELVPKRFSDWEKSSVSPDTGRSIVHLFDVEDESGKIKSVSADSANILLGFSKRGDSKLFGSLSNALKTLAKLKMQLAATEQAANSWDSIYSDISKKSPSDISVKDITMRPEGYIENIIVDIGGYSYTYVNFDRGLRSMDDVEYQISDQQYDLGGRILTKFKREYMKSNDMPPVKPSIGDLPEKIQRQERKIDQIIQSQGQ